MKPQKLIILASSITASAIAGTPSPVVAPAPEPAPSLGGWFIGGSFGQLKNVDNSFIDLVEEEIDEDSDFSTNDVEVDDLDFNLYTLHAGRDLGTQFLGCDVAAYLEVAYLDGEMGVSASGFSSFEEDFITESYDVDLDIIPVTLNLKLERNLFGALSAYGTVGAGYAFSKISAEGESERDGGFYAQASAGLLYNFNQSFEGYAGARWLYLDSVGIGDMDDFEIENDFAWEVGLRYNF